MDKKMTAFFFTKTAKTAELVWIQDMVHVVSIFASDNRLYKYSTFPDTVNGQDLS